MLRLHFKYDYQAAILENQLRAITPELMAGSTPSFNHWYIYLLGIFYGFSQEVSTMALAISFHSAITTLPFSAIKNLIFTTPHSFSNSFYPKRQITSTS
jgi:hypothetical protein